MDLYNDDSAAAVLARCSPCSSSTLKWLHCCIPSILLSPNIPTCIGGEWETSTGWISTNGFLISFIRSENSDGEAIGNDETIFIRNLSDLWTKFTNGHRLTVHRFVRHQNPPTQNSKLIQFNSNPHEICPIQIWRRARVEKKRKTKN